MRKERFSVTLFAFVSCSCGGEIDGRAEFIGVVLEMCFRTNTSAFPPLARSADKRAEAEFSHNVHISYLALKRSASIQDGSKQVKISRLSVTTGTTRQKNTLNMVRERKQHLSHSLMLLFFCLKVVLYLHSLIFIQ